MDDICMMDTGFGALLTPEEGGKKNELITKTLKINIKNFDTNDETITKEHNQIDETNSTIKKEAHTKENEDWSPNAICCLLNAWHDHNKNANGPSKLDMDCIWEEISKEVSGRSGNSKKPKDYEQCKLKLKTMQGRYNREKMAKKFNPKEPNSWEWYDTMNTIFSGTPCFKSDSMDIKNITKVASVINNKQRLTTYYDVREKSVEEHNVEENAPTKLSSIDRKNKPQDINHQEYFNSKVYKDNNVVRHNNLSIPTSPKSPRSFTKVKRGNSCSPRLKLNDKFKEEESLQENMSNPKLPYYEDEQRKSLLVDEIEDEKLTYGEQDTSNSNRNILDRNSKGTLKTFDSCFDSSMNFNESDTMDQDSATSSPNVFMASQTKFEVNKSDDIYNGDEDQRMRSFTNCNYKQACIESVTNSKQINENREILDENISKEGKKNSHIFNDLRRIDKNLATNVDRTNEQMALNIARDDSEGHLAKIVSTESPMASVTSQSESSFTSKQKRKLPISLRYKFERENRSIHTLIKALMHTTSNLPRFKKKNRFTSHASHAHESNTITPLMTFEATIQQLEKNHIAFMERLLNEQSTVLNDFVKILKHNDQVREATMVGLIVRFFLSTFLVGIILYGTSKTSSSWMATSSQSNSWIGKSNDDYVFELTWIGCFIIVIASQLLWTFFRRRPVTS